MMDPLYTAAREAQNKAYVPYSRFKVGAAVRDERGRVHAGCNIENAAYPQGWCAETSAIAALIMAGGTRITEVAVIGTGELLCTPCGGCRQKIREFAEADTKISCYAESGKLLGTFSLTALLPHSFGPENLAE